MGKSATIKEGTVTVQVDAVSLSVELAGDWTVDAKRAGFDCVETAARKATNLAKIRVSGNELSSWDAGLLIFLLKCRSLASAAGVELDVSELPKGAQRLFKLSSSPVDAESKVEATDQEEFFGVIGGWFLEATDCLLSFWRFLGELTVHCLELVAGRGCLRRKDLLVQLDAVGPRAVPIVCLLSFLTGLIIAFIGVLQLKKFAADIYVADLVGLALTRELGALMVGIILAGRTGAAFAAQLGSMRVNEEIDALESFGISPMQFLVLPRVFALILMIPLLYAFAILVGILGGLLVSTSVSNVTALQFFVQLETAVGLNDFLGGLFKSVVFGCIIALAGCYRGLNCGKDATAVGQAATSAVVTAITWIVISDAVFAVIFNMIGF
jgi:phospholipid/cholesterol/gamma-HCH transport system permease protein